MLHSEGMHMGGGTFTFLALLLGSAVAGATAGADGGGAAGPVLKVEPAEVVFEAVYAGHSAEQQVRLSNAGGSPLLISEVTSSCGCMTTGLSTRQLAPGESTELTITFRSSRSQAGRTIAKDVTIVSNDTAGGGSLVLPVQAKVVAAVLVEPDAVTLAELRPGSVIRRDVSLTATDGALFRITSATARDGNVQVATSGGHDALSHTISVEVRAGSTGQPFGADVVLVETTHPRDSQLRIPVSWRLEQLVAVRPHHVALGRCAPGQTVRRTIFVVPTKRDRFEMLSFRLDPDTISLAAIRDPEREHAWDLAFNIPAGLTPQRLRGTLLIDTHVEPEGTVEIPFSGVVSTSLDLLPDVK
jgi:hypothetical protein